jgi:hypothetical protein
MLLVLHGTVKTETERMMVLLAGHLVVVKEEVEVDVVM